MLANSTTSRLTSMVVESKGQAEALRLAIARALVKINAENKTRIDPKKV